MKYIHCAAHLLALLGWGRDLVACGSLDCLRWICDGFENFDDGFTTDINNGNRNRFTTVAKFGPLDPIVTFFHSHDVIYLCNCYFRVQNRFFSVKIKMW